MGKHEKQIKNRDNDDERVMKGVLLPALYIIQNDLWFFVKTTYCLFLSPALHRRDHIVTVGLIN